MTKRTVTVFVTVFNIEPHLERFFDCLRQQTYTDFEALLIDDGSTDNSRAICEAHAQADDRIRVIAVEHIGISAARNLALSKIETPFAVSLDGDDYYEPDYLWHLMDAEQRTGADMVISNVVYVYEDGKEKERFSPRPQGVYRREDFSALLPALLDENRLSYLYAKLYKTALLRDVRVEPDVMQGSDTMINIQYLARAESVATIEDYDYYYVQYDKRAVTSYKGADFLKRLYRINQFLLEKTAEYGFLNDEMLRVIDGRFLLSGRAFLNKIGGYSCPLRKKYRLAEEAVATEEYLRSYRRQKERGNLKDYRFEVIAPGGERAYIDHVCRVTKEEKKNARLQKRREMCPDFIFHMVHGVKSKLGIARKQ